MSQALLQGCLVGPQAGFSGRYDPAEEVVYPMFVLCLTVTCNAEYLLDYRYNRHQPRFQAALMPSIHAADSKQGDRGLCL